MISLRSYLQLHLDSLYGAVFGVDSRPVPTISDVVKTAYLAATAHGLGRLEVERRLESMELSVAPSSLSYRALFARAASYYVDNDGPRSYIPPDLPVGSGTREVPTSLILPPPTELDVLMLSRLQFLSIDIPERGAS
jgi:hypothetical protein